MKIHNLGNDYAYQQRLKKKADNAQRHQPIVQPEIMPTDNVENQLQTWGETTVATIDSEAGSGEKALEGEATKTSRRRKKEKAEASQLSSEC